jgi:hypothetical protein
VETVTDPRAGLQQEPEPQEPESGEDEPSGLPEDDGYSGDLTLKGPEQLSFAVGGKTPTSSSLRLQGGKVEIEGAFRKGDRIVLTVECEVRGIGFRDEVDQKTGQVVGCARNHVAHITAVERQ